MNIIFIIVILVAFSVITKIVQKKVRIRKELKRRQQIGKSGEEDTIRQMEKIRGHKQILRNLYVPLSDGRNTTEIDAVMIHEKGIIVVENKNYSGKIYGDEEDYHWTQVKKNGWKKEKKDFYSPVKQNWTHIRRLKKFLTGQTEKWKLPYISVITFNDSARLKRIFISSDEVLVSESRKVKRRLRRKLKRMPRVLTEAQVDELYEVLKCLEHPGGRVKRLHERYVRRGR